MKEKLLILLSLLFLSCGGSNNRVQEDTTPIYYPVENCSDFVCNQCTYLFSRNNINLVCLPVIKCASVKCLHIVNYPLYMGIVGICKENGNITVTTYDRTEEEIAETMAHEIGHYYGLPHHQVCNNIMAQDSVCVDVRTELEDWQREYFN